MKDANQELAEAANAGDHAKVFDLLAGGANPRSQDSKALRAAAANGHAECVRLLLPVSDALAMGSAALMWAALNGHAECVRMLAGASGPLIGFNGLLEEVFERGHAKMAAVLIEHEPRLLDGINLPKCVAEAHEKGHADMAGFLSSIIDQRELAGVAQDAEACWRPKACKALTGRERMGSRQVRLLDETDKEERDATRQH